MSIEEWVNVKQDKWIDKQRLENLDDLDLLLVKQLKITYVSGKGNNHLVPVLISVDTAKAREKLSDPEVRKQAGILESNNYLFASTHNSVVHVSEWHALHNVCASLTVKETENTKVTANRHRVSTLFAALDLSQCDLWPHLIEL